MAPGRSCWRHMNKQRLDITGRKANQRCESRRQGLASSNSTSWTTLVFSGSIHRERQSKCGMRSSECMW
jgi:hypothetical protein